MSRRLLVLSRNDPLEAMRVAAGLTIFGHTVELVLMNRELTNEEAESEQAELLELTEITPVTTVAAMAEHFDYLNDEKLATYLQNADTVINL